MEPRKTRAFESRYFDLHARFRDIMKPAPGPKGHERVKHRVTM